MPKAPVEEFRVFETKKARISKSELKNICVSTGCTI
jgi:hypothetical protein